MITPILIGITSACSLYALWFNPRVLDWGMLRPHRTLREHRWHELITSGFLHGSLGHLLVNMLVLLVFGLTVERSIGIGHMLTLYVSGVVISAIPSLIRHADNPAYATLGASGAVESVLFLFIFLFPTDRIILLFLPVGIPAWLFGLAFLAYSLGASRRGGGRVNHEAHIAGSLWGVLYPLLFIPNSADHLLTLLGLL